MIKKELTEEEIKWLKELRSIDSITYPDGSVGNLNFNVMLI